MDNPPPSKSGTSPTTKTRTSLTKAQRRELQERQNAAKAMGTPISRPNGSAKHNKSPNVVSERLLKQPESRSSHKTQFSISSLKDVRSVASTDADNMLRDLRIFSHFTSPSKSLGPKIEIHPAIQRLAAQFSEFGVSGGNARCIATCKALKSVIQDYTTPPQTSLPRHIMSHISPQITHLVTARPMSTSMGSAIRYLKTFIRALSDREAELPEKDAKDLLCHCLDTFIRDRIILADHVIREAAMEKIKDGDVVMTFAKSSAVENALIYASECGRDFQVYVVDSGPLFEGKRLLSSLNDRGIRCSYCLITAIGTAIGNAHLVLLGAHSLYANGALYSRAGTALVAMAARQRSVPVLVCCETYKFSNGVPFDGFTKNELGKSTSGVHNETFLQMLNPLYDLTPAQTIEAVVTELGLIPPSSVPTVLARAGAQD